VTGYDEHGPVEGPPIVFVHATRLTRAMWTPQVTRLSDTFRVVTLDLPGHGTRASERFTLDAAADAVAETIDRAAAGRAVVAGLSLGGYVAMHLAGRSPERVRALVVADATAEPVGLLSVPYRALGWSFMALQDRGLATLNRWFFRGRFAPELADPIVAGGFWGVGGAEALRSLVGHRFRPSLASYPGPTLLLTGSLDLPFLAGRRGFAASAQDARSVRIPRATHLSNLDQPDAFSEAIRRFVAALPADLPADRPAGPPRD
jgi:pimeloyl-ACP methyl ester carboxylesterase